MTSTAIESAVHRVISDMHVNLGQDLTIDDMARTAMFSKFHFTRVFRDVTGTSPGRFLSALRLQEAKRLLVDTKFSVADISSQVGYSSVGTFSSRFKSCVGVSPSMYRELGGYAPAIETDPAGKDVTSRSVLRGRIVFPQDRDPGYCFLGLFPTPVPQGQPVRCSVLDGPGSFELRDIPPGTWYLLVHSVPYSYEEQPSGTGDQDVVSVGRYGPVTAHADTLLLPAEVTLRPVDALEPPVLMALLDLRLNALERRAAAS